MFLNEIILSLILLINVSICDERKRQYFVRKSTKEFKYKDWQDYKRGLAVMKARDPLDPTSFAYQTNIHGWLGYDGSAEADAMVKKYDWHQCQHHHYWFLIWHRMFLYFFERILRKASGNPRFALPYWEYDIDEGRQMPLPFRLPANETTNPLYIHQRCRSTNDGKPLPKQLTNPRPSMKTQFFSANKFTDELNVCNSFGGGPVDRPKFLSNRPGAIEWNPHNSVHVTVGGPDGAMTNLCVAFRDPIFPVHHTQIERIWQSWSRLGGPHETDDHYMNQTFNFYDENGVFGTYYVRDFADISTLDYRYDKLIASERVEPLVSNERPRLYFDVETNKTLIITEINNSLILDIKAKYLPFFEDIAKGKVAKNKVRFTLQAVHTFAADPAVYFQMYLNLPVGAQPFDDNPYFIATFLTAGVKGCAPLNDRKLRNISRCVDITNAVFAVLKNNYNYFGHIPNHFNLTAVARSCDSVYHPINGSEAMLTFSEVLIIHYFID